MPDVKLPPVVQHDDPIRSGKEIKDVLRRHKELPRSFIAALTRRSQANPALKTALKNLADDGDLSRFDYGRKIAKHFSYTLNEKYLRNTADRPHRVGEGLITASTEIGVMQNPEFRYMAWPELLTMSGIPKELLNRLDEGGDPHHISLSEGFYHPDCAPERIYHAPSNKQMNIITEYDRDTENLTGPTARRSIETMFEKMREFFDRKLYYSHYGFTNCIARVVTVSTARKQALMRLYEKNHGPCKHIIFTEWDDWYLARSYPAPDGTMFTRPYERVGHPDYYITKFFDMDLV